MNYRQAIARADGPQERRLLLREVLSVLSLDELFVFMAEWGIAMPPMRQGEIAAEFGKTRAWVAHRDWKSRHRLHRRFFCPDWMNQ